METVKEVKITRIFNAPRALVWKVWTDPELLQRWWGPKGFTNPVCEIDVKVGGSILIHMKGPDGIIYPMTGTFNEIVKPERIVFKSIALDSQGNYLFEIMNTITLVENKNKTELTITAVVSEAGPQAAPYLAGMNEGWNQSLDKLEELVLNL